MAIAHAVLSLLASSDRCGYDIRRDLEHEFGPDWRLDFGQLYRLLANIERAGWARVQTAPGVRGPERKIYSITASGRAELRRWLEEPEARVARGRDELPVKLRLAFGASGSPEALAQALAGRRQEATSRLVAERAACAQALPAGEVGTWILTDRRRREAEAAVAWLDNCQGLIEGGRRRSAGRVSTVRFAGSDDLLLDLLARHVTRSTTSIRFDGPRLGSLGGLMALRDGRAELAGTHLLDIDSGQYNVSFVKHLLPEEPMLLVTLAHREQGILVAPGNPKRIHGVRDLARRHVRMINRQPGAGTRLLLFHHLRRNAIDPRKLAGYEREVQTHAAVAAAIKAGTADAGPGIRAAAEASGLDFVPLARERYDLAVPRRVFDARAFRALLDVLHGTEFRNSALTLPGYDTTEIGRIAADLR